MSDKIVKVEVLESTVDDMIYYLSNLKVAELPYGLVEPVYDMLCQLKYAKNRGWYDKMV